MYSEFSSVFNTVCLACYPKKEGFTGLVDLLKFAGIFYLIGR